MDAPLANAALALFSAACVAAVLSMLRRSDALYRLTAALATGGFAALSLGLILRRMEAGHAPLTTFYETLVFLAWASWLLALVLLIPLRMQEPAMLIPFICAACLGYASTLDASIRPLVPALRSNWLLLHVAACFLGYAGLAAGCAAGLGLAVALRRRRPAAQWERSAVRCIRFGFLFLTYGILSGSVWANEAWTTYWGWDPKEIWALLTWLVYFSFLVLRSRRPAERSPRMTVLFSVGGFCAVLFTYFGVSFLLAGLHSYF
ncbi:MAG: cytochrome c biogenesis protein CcsA [bacterium]|nr:cytochrome c biogenesis protein CcsA [bacterium]